MVVTDYTQSHLCVFFVLTRLYDVLGTTGEKSLFHLLLSVETLKWPEQLIEPKSSRAIMLLSGFHRIQTCQYLPTASPLWRVVAQGPREKIVPTRRGERWREPSPHHCPHTLQARIACKITFSRGLGVVERNSLFWHGAVGLCHKDSSACASLTKCLHKTRYKTNDSGLREQHVGLMRVRKVEEFGRLLAYQ